MKKYIPTIALPILMLGVVASAFFLPKLFLLKPQNEKSTSLVSWPTATAAIQESELAADITIPSRTPSQAAIDYGELLKPLITKLENDELIGAEQTLKQLRSQIPEIILRGFTLSIKSARDSRRELAALEAEMKQKNMALAIAEREKIEVAAASKKLEQTRIATEARIAKLEKESAERIKSSLDELQQAAQAAKEAAAKAEQSARDTENRKVALSEKSE